MSGFPSRATTQSKKRRVKGATKAIDKLIEKRPETEFGIKKEEEFGGTSITMSEWIGNEHAPDYTPNKEEEGESLVVINALKGLTPKQTTENRKDCQWMRRDHNIQPQYHLEPKFKQE